MMQNKIKVVGLTGGSGSGKSTVSKIFEKKGACIIDGDKISRQITEKNSPVLEKLKNAFGDEIINSDGTLNRRGLGSIVFSDKKSLELLNSITHPAIYDETVKIIDGKKSEFNVFIIDAAAIFDCKPLLDLCEKIIVVCADKHVRINRICLRDGILEKDAENRINSQTDQDILAKKADFVIYNNDSAQNLEKSADEVWNCL